jgi:hypothetical protein
MNVSFVIRVTRQIDDPVAFVLLLFPGAWENLRMSDGSLLEPTIDLDGDPLPLPSG